MPLRRGHEFQPFLVSNIDSLISANPLPITLGESYALRGLLLADSRSAVGKTHEEFRNSSLCFGRSLAVLSGGRGHWSGHPGTDPRRLRHRLADAQVSAPRGSGAGGGIGLNWRQDCGGKRYFAFCCQPDGGAAAGEV